MDAAFSGWLLVIILLVIVVTGAAVVHVIEWHLYTATRAERDMLRENLSAMTSDRDGWRSVGERALLVAQFGKRITTRATRAVTQHEKEP